MKLTLDILPSVSGFMFILFATGIVTACIQNRTSSDVTLDTTKAKTSTLDIPPLAKKPVEHDPAAYSQELAKSVGLEISELKETAMPKIRSYFAPGANAEERAKYHISEYARGSGTLIVATAEDLPDDSIYAEQLYAVFRIEASPESLTEFGMRIKCRRGGSVDSWQTELCP